MEGGFSSCQCLLYSVDFATIQDLQHKGDWVALDALMADAARRLTKAVLTSLFCVPHTMHLCKDAIQSAVPIPFLHIADAAGAAVKNQGLKKVGLLGTKFTMEKDFYKKVLKDQHGIDTIIPEQNDRAEIHRIIYDELVKGVFAEESRQIYQRIITNLQQKGAEGVIL
ncbi:MAG: aspartate/glutamate racemase family protein, partial [Chitinophagales bacterium]